MHVNVHGDDDEVQQDGRHDARDGLHASGLRCHVPDDDGLHDARLGDVREDVRDVRRNVHDVLQYVHADEAGRDDDALRGNVQALRRILQHDEQNVHGRLSVRHCIVPQSVQLFRNTKRSGGWPAPFVTAEVLFTKTQSLQKVQVLTDGQSSYVFCSYSCWADRHS